MNKLEEIEKILKKHRAGLKKAQRQDSEYTIGGNGVNSSEAGQFFDALEAEINAVLKRK